jgi:hypothetical protein
MMTSFLLANEKLTGSSAAGAAIGWSDWLSIFIFNMQSVSHLRQFLIKGPNWNTR